MEHADSVAPAAFPERISPPREGTALAGWQGLGASLLLHLLVGAAVVASLPPPPKTAPQVVDLTLLPPSPAPSAPAPSFPTAAEPAIAPGKPVGQEPPDSSVLSTPANRPADAAPVSRSDAGAERNVPAAATGPPRPVAVFSPSSPGIDDAAGGGGGRVTTGDPSVKTGGGSPAETFAYVRDAVQRKIIYPATARRMGWEGKVVVAFRLLPDGSVRDVRVVHGSGHAALDRGAIDAVRNASPFPRSPVEAEVITPVVYRLTTR